MLMINVSHQLREAARMIKLNRRAEPQQRILFFKFFAAHQFEDDDEQRNCADGDGEGETVCHVERLEIGD